jgi:tetratricopeptide (TPR) repeat protein/transcriptional regulator with XRE-family HTH domain
LLRQLRAEAGLTQEELAQAAGLGLRTVSDLERGTHRTAHQDTARLLADALGLAGPVQRLFVAAARGQGDATEVLAARRDAAAAVATESVPAAPAVPVPRELPPDAAEFTGREVELAELDLLVPGATQQGAGVAVGPVVISAVSGTAGVGKTALAVRWAHQAAEAFPDGQLYVNLRGYDPDQPLPPGEALAGFLRALGVADSEIPLGDAERAARYRSRVAGKRLLVVLDNAATEEQVRPLLPGSGSVMVVVTSRDSLAGLVARDGARRLDLDLLPQGEAVALLRALIGARADAEHVAAEALAWQCARLPLALRVAAELAAARPDTPLMELVAELADERARLALLDGGGDPRTAVASVFSWSYRHLNPDAARLFRLLGLHPATDWDQYAAAALTATSATDAGRLLAVLARAHLIQPTGSGRYGMHDLLRAYAASLAATIDHDDAWRQALTRLFDYYLAACSAAADCLVPAGRHLRPDPPHTDLPVPDLRARADAQGWLDAELATLTAVAIHTAQHGWPGHTIHLFRRLYRYLYAGGHLTTGLTIGYYALNAARDSGDRADQARMLTSLGQIHGTQGRPEQAVGYHTEALALVRGLADRFIQAFALSNLGSAYLLQDRYRQAIACYRQAIALHREVGDQAGEALALSNLGNTYQQMGRYRSAEDMHWQALTVCREANDQYGVAQNLMGVGEDCFALGRYEEAHGYLRQALAITHELSDLVTEAGVLAALGEVQERQGHYDEAGAYYQRALALNRESGERFRETWALIGMGNTLLATGQPDQAHAHYVTALTLARQASNRSLQASALTRLGEVCRQQSEHGHAAGHHRQALILYREIGDRGGQAQALNGTGEVLLATGQPSEAHQCHTTALTLARRTGDRYQQARAHRGLAAACHITGQPGEARQHWQHALDLYNNLGVPEAAEMRTSLATAEQASAGTL